MAGKAKLAAKATVALASSKLGISPVPAVNLVRMSPDLTGLGAAPAATPYVPSGIRTVLDAVYDASSPEGILDVFTPDDGATALPTIFWMHGGGFIAGEKWPLRDYLAVLASHGFTVVNVEYTHAPEAIYPTPIRQLNAAIAFVIDHAGEYRVDPNRILLAGDSAGAHMAAQTAMAIAQPDYAAAAQLPAAISPEQLVGTVQFSGAYDPNGVNFKSKAFGFFMTTVMWAYSGTKKFLTDPLFQMTALPRYVTSQYPPTFVSTGPADPLLSQNEAWVAALKNVGVPVTTLFFDPETTAATVGHEYQLDIAGPQGRQALRAIVEFIRGASHADFREGVADVQGW